MGIEQQTQFSEDEKKFQLYVDDLRLKPEDFEKIILDVGAGDAGFAKWAKDNNISSQIYSLEPFQEMLEKENGLVGNAEKIPMPDKTFDLVLSNSAIPNIYLGEENIEEKVKKSFYEMLRVLKEDGEIRLARVLIGDKYDSQKVLGESIKKVFKELQEKNNIKIEKIRTPDNDVYESGDNGEDVLLAESFFVVLKKTDVKIEKNDLVPVPKENLEFSREKAEKWIEAEGDLEIKEIKRKIIENIQHISFVEFQEKAQEVVTQAVRSLAENNEKYALLFDYKPHSSKKWMFELNKNCYTENPPTKVDYFTPSWEKMSGDSNLRKMVESGINTFLISDDGAYSGEQIFNRQIDPIVKFYESEKIQKKPKFVLAIPFITSRFLKLVEDMKNKYGCEIEVYSNSKMPTLAEILSVDEIKILNDKRNGALEATDDDPTYLGATLTYFDHRVADDHSFSGEVQKVLELSANKPYSDENSDYYKKEDQEFKIYKDRVFPSEEIKKEEPIIQATKTIDIMDNKKRDEERLVEVRKSLGLI